jgi:hypothetical protein
MTADTELWACRVCRSINSRRSNRCYSCHTPREAAAVNPAELPTTGAAPPVIHTGSYQSTEMRAVLLTVAAIAFILGTFASTFLLWQVGSLRAAGDRAAANDLFDGIRPILVLVPIFGVLALLAYAAWISRVVANLPALKLGYSRVSATMAFIEPLIPGFNLYALPARLGEVLKKLDEKGNGLPLLGLAAVLFLAPAVVAGIAIRLSREFETTGDFLRTSGFTLFLAFVFQAIGLLIGVYLVWQVERLARTRSESEATNASTPASPASPAPADR